jgi:hypothetical protein
MPNWLIVLALFLALWLGIALFFGGVQWVAGLFVG